MNRDDLLVSLHLDGRLEGPEKERFERRLATEPALHARYEESQRLQRLSAGLAATRGAFCAEDLRTRPERPEARVAGFRRRLALSAAAVLLLAATHGAAYLFGARRGGQAAQAVRTPVEEAEALLDRAARLDPATPYDTLRSELVSLRERVRPLPRRLAVWAEAEPGAGERAAELASTLHQFEVAFDQVEDPAFLSVTLSDLARGAAQGRAVLRMLPATARTFARLEPAGDGRYRLLLVELSDGRPRIRRDEGTLAELETRHAGIRFVSEGNR